MKSDPMLAKKTEALRSQVMRALGLTEWPKSLHVTWENMVGLVEMHGTEALDDMIAGFRGTLEGEPDPEPR